jgi:Uma2 family endonuclease
MATVEKAAPVLERGDFLTREEFLRRWEGMPEVKRAELIGGVVYMPSPLGREHGSMDLKVAGWLAVYVAATPGCDALSNATWLMRDDAPQPDTSLYVLPEYGGPSRMSGRLIEGVPEFVAEVCGSDSAYDLHQKLELYQESGVREYLAVLLQEREARWHRLVGGRFVVVPADGDSLYRSQTFPGLWLDPAALLAGDLSRVLAVLNDGLRSPGHAAWVAELARRR